MTKPVHQARDEAPVRADAAAADREAPYLADLNPAQREAVAALDGPVLVLAGAGTGKTRVLTTRLAHLLRTGRAHPGEILAVTFTNKAAQEMRDRVSGLLGRPVEGWWLGTFHALAARMLRRDAELIGLTPRFTIIDTDDQLRLVKQILSAEEIDDKKWPARGLLAAIQRWKDRGLTPERVSASEAGDLAGGRAVELYSLYQSRLKTLNACDFGDLMLHVLTLFQSHPEVLARYHQQFRYLLVDEYQDTNVIQYLWLRLLAQTAPHNICCVGDDDQSIYGWRGAEVGNILRFEADFPGAKVIRLERNYRSTGHILAAASGLIAHNESRLGKTLWTEDGEGEAVRLRGLWDGEAEARFVADEIEALQRKGHALSEVAILVRTGAQTREFEERFITVGLPYRVIGGPRFYERAEIRDALAYLRLVFQPDDGLAFERIVNKPKRGLGDATLRQLHTHARARDVSLTRAAQELVESDELRPAARRALGEFLEGLARWRHAADGLHHCDLAELVLDESGYTEMWQNDKSLDAPGRLENLKELIVAMDEFETLGGFLEHVSLVMEAAENRDQDQVNVMTLHSAKGLEFDTVFLAGWEEGLFPNQRALDETGLRGLEEERRLAYVGLTRARRRAIVSFAANRRLHGSWAAAIPSRFVDELSGEAVVRESDPGLYGSAGGSGSGLLGGLDSATVAGWSDSRWTPGMARARQRAGQAEPFIDVVPRVVESLPGQDFAAGARVFHQKFGYGTVRKVEGERLTIGFDRAGDKKVMASFVVPEDQAG
jgi:DNA helicase-2/ATP-dependent DNA helicase PcrA